MAAATNTEREAELVLLFRAADSADGLTRDTWKSVAQQHGLSETEAIHRAMVMFASTGTTMKMLPQEPLPFDLSGFDLTDLAAFAKNADPCWVERAADVTGNHSHLR